MKKIVVIGGGHGSECVLRGIKRYELDITAVVTVFDSGGSTGKLRREFGALPIGDVRRCLVALSQENSDKLFQRLFDFRFSDVASPFNGHSFGNLLLFALTQMNSGETEAIAKAGKILNIKGRVLPVSLDRAHVDAELENGQVIHEEENIDVPKHDGALRIRRVFLNPQARMYASVGTAIDEADLVVFAPGDLYTSIIPNLLAENMSDALQKSHAKKVFVLNLMTKWGETNGFTASDFVREVLSYAGFERFDAIIVNKRKLPKETLDAYALEKKHPVPYDEACGELASTIVMEDLYAEGEGGIRHDSQALASILMLFAGP
ncbi:MAG: YvcK family protein [bacterium]|nr:YvcK family protein [bacterium]